MAGASTLPNFLTMLDSAPTAAQREAPHNVQAEQVLLGVILTNNEALLRVDDFLLPEHFYEPVHQRVHQAIKTMLERGMIATAVTLKHSFDKDPALIDIGGAEYLQRLAGLATAIINVHDYGRMIYDLALRRKLITIGEDIVNTAYNTAVDTDANQQIEQAEQHLFALASEGQLQHSFQTLKSSLAQAIKRAELAFQRKEEVTGISSGFADLDKLLGGFQESDLLILAGRPSMGKTALAVNMAVNSCRFLYEQHNKQKTTDEEVPPPSIGFFSLEMSSEQLAARILSMLSGINAANLRTGHIHEGDFSKLVEANRVLQNYPFFIDDTPALTISGLRTRARRLKRRHNLGMLVVDYLQLLRGSAANKDGNRVQEVSEITQGLKALAKELNVPIIALSQLSRAVEQREDKRPQLADLRESGSIEQDADIVMFIYRDEYYISRKEPIAGTEAYDKWQQDIERVRNLAEVIIAKHRNGPIGHVTLHFESSTTRFSNHMPM